MQIWDRRFLEQAKSVADWSKDPSTKCGSVIVRPNRTVAAMGFNGFPRGMRDDDELYADRTVKYTRVIHCEMNAILTAREPLNGYTLYVYPFLTCDRCAVHVIQAGIKRVVAPLGLDADRDARWHEEHERARGFYREVNVICDEFQL